MIRQLAVAYSYLVRLSERAKLPALSIAKPAHLILLAQQTARKLALVRSRELLPLPLLSAVARAAYSPYTMLECLYS